MTGGDPIVPPASETLATLSALADTLVVTADRAADTITRGSNALSPAAVGVLSADVRMLRAVASAFAGEVDRLAEQ